MSLPPPAIPMVAWKKELGLAALLALVPIAVAVAFVCCCGDWFRLVEDDGWDQYQPLLTACLNRTLAGEWPLWSPDDGCGFPLLARSPALYPPHYISHFLCWLLGLQWQEIAVSHILHLGAAAAAAFLYLRFLAVGRWPASLAALGYSLGGPLLGMATNWNDVAFLVPYFPLAFLVVEHLVTGHRSWFWPCLGGLLGGLVFVATGPLGTFKYSLLFGLYFTVRARRDTLGFAFSRLLVAALLAFLGCAGQLAASWELLQMSTRIQGEGMSVAEGLSVLACPPEFYRGFVYPLVEFQWPRTPAWSDHFNGGGLFVGPLAVLGLFLALAHIQRPGPHRALTILVLIYFVLSLGFYFDGNAVLQSLPLFREHRWPVRWTIEFCALAALLTGVGLQLGWKHARDVRTRWALAAYLLVVFLALTLRTSESTAWEFDWKFLVAPWLLVSGLLALLFYTQRARAFYLLALAATLGALLVNVPGVQRHRFGTMRQLVEHPLELNRGSVERVLYLSPRKEQLEADGEGNYAYCLTHLLSQRSVTTYGPAALRIQSWQAGLDSQAQVYDAEAAADAFLKGHLLDTLRVSHVVVPRGHALLNAACRTHPQLRWQRDTTSKSIYVHEGFRKPAFFVQEARPETELDSWSKLGRAPLQQVCYIESTYDGPRNFEPAGKVREFREEKESISLHVETKAPQLLVITTTWYPGWQASLDGAAIPLYRVNGSFMAVQVPPGSHEVSLHFQPSWLVALLVLNLVVVLLLAGSCSVWVLLHLWRERRLLPAA